MIKQALKDLIGNPAIAVIQQVAKQTLDDPALENLDDEKKAIVITTVESMLFLYFMMFVDPNLSLELMDWIDQVFMQHNELIPLLNFEQYVD